VTGRSPANRPQNADTLPRAQAEAAGASALKDGTDSRH